MKKYNRHKKIAILFVAAGIMWLTIAIIDLLTTGPSISIATAIIFFLGFFLMKRPYVLLSDSKMEVYHNTIFSKQYDIDNLKVISQNDKVILFEYQNGTHVRKFKVHLNRLGSQDSINFKTDLMALLK